MHRLSFTHAHSYAGRDAGITLPVVLLSSIRVKAGGAFLLTNSWLVFRCYT
jgi:hypothetical protein